MENAYYNEKKSGYAIAKELKVPKYTIDNAITKYGIKRRTLKVARRPGESKGVPGHKWCPGCKTDKLMANFSANKKNSDGKDSYCKDCISVKSKKYFHSRNEKRTLVKAKYVSLLGNKCSVCGAENLPIACYQFHHNDPAVKEYQISNFLSGYKKDIEREIKKCSLVCANCHQVIHANGIRLLDIKESS